MQISLFRAFLCLLSFYTFAQAYSFTATLDKTSFMVGEKATVSLKFCYDNLEEYTLEEPQLLDFNVALLNEEEKQETNTTTCVLQHYTLRAKEAGTFTLPTLKAHIESIPPKYQERYNKNHYLQKLDIYTNALPIEVIPLPEGLSVTGNYSLTASVDSTTVQAQTPLHLTVTLHGEGNIENLDFLILSIPHTLIYPHKTEGLSKTFDIIAKANYTIPSITLTYFNQEEQMVERIHTESYPITVTGISVQKSKNIWVWLLLSVIYIGLFYAVYCIFKTLDFIDQKKILFKRIKSAKNKEALLKVIAPYMHQSKGLERLVYRVEMSERSAFKGLKKETTTQMHLLTQNSNKFK